MRAPRPDYRAIWDTVRQVPRGKVATYGEIARLSGLMNQARRVGYALHTLPPRSGVPWHRIVNARGEISLPEISGGYQRQKKLLLKEGIAFRKGRIDLARFGWFRSMEPFAYTLPPRRRSP
jgi:methylated-DNA-protein-cysteine methyltransferase-like protein